MANQIYTYSLIRAYYDAGEDYIDSFWPFIVCVLSKDHKFSIDTIQKKISDKYSLIVPIHTLKVILTRAKRADYLIQAQQQIFLTQKGVEYQQNLEIPRDVERRINSFVGECKQYLEERHKLQITSEDLNDRIESFLKTNSQLVEEYFSQQSTDFIVQDQFNGIDEIDKAILDFFIYVENQKPESYNTLRDLITGSIISIVLSSEDISKITKKNNNLTIYLDTNIVLSILDLDIEEFCKPAQELYKILIDDRTIQLKIFDFTLKEVVSVLQNYIPNINNYISGVKVRSLYSKLKSKGWTRADLREYLVNIEAYLAEKKIRIEPTKIDLDIFTLDNPDYRLKIKQYKPEQGLLAQSHDLAAIKLIKDLRPSLMHKLENAKALFITSDKKLATYNFIEWGHKISGTIAEVFPDSVMTNILWLKNPQSLETISVETLISMHSKSGIIDNNIWCRFMSIVKELRNNENINDKDIALLIYDSRIQDDLVEAKHDELTEAWVHDRIVRAKRELDEEEKAKIKIIEYEKGKEIQGVTDRVFDSIQKAKEEIRKRASLISNIIVNIISVIFLGFVLFSAWKFFPYFLNQWDAVEPFISLINILFTITTMSLLQKGC